jgi:chemotaxis protein MotB
MEGQKRRVRRKHSEEHGGSHGAWKVAYADFVTAMMAFFLLLWLLSMTSTEQRARVSAYFKYFSIFDSSSSSSLVDLSQTAMTPIAVMEKEATGEDKKAKKDRKASKGSKEIQADERSLSKKDIIAEQQKKEELQSRLKKIIEKELADVKSQIIVDGFKNCVRVQMVDDEGSMMFPTGSTMLTGRAQEVLKVITESVKDFSGPIAIEGHTDAKAYPSQDYTNWELSVGRASAARKQMVASGLDVSQIIRVTGFADKKLINKEDPYDPRNRRISILFYKSPEKRLPTIAPINVLEPPNNEQAGPPPK